MTTRIKTFAICLVVTITLTVVFSLIAPHYSTKIVWFARGQSWWVIPLLALVFLWVTALQHVQRHSVRARDATGLAWAYSMAGVLGAVLLLGWGFYHSYVVSRVYASSITVTSDPLPTYFERAPYQVADSQASSNMGDTQGDIASTRYLLDADDYGTLVKRRGRLTGYESLLVQKLPLTGRGSATQCDFAPVADARIGGLFGHSLERQVHGQRRHVRAREEDSYGYCKEGRPVVVMPLVRQQGLLRVTVVPAGVAMYDGRTGAVTFAESADVGPSYPISVAARQRTASHALGSFSDYVWRRAGYDSTDDTPNDPNLGNTTEFTLAGESAAYVTPLTVRGRATSISFISEVSTAGRRGLAPLTVHRLDPTWLSTDSFVKRIQGDYQDIPNYQNLTVFEVAPLDGRRWVATLGNDQNILYRVQGTGDLQPTAAGLGDATCLFRADGSRIRCGTLADQNGSGVGTQFGPQTGTAEPRTGQTPLLPTDLAGLTAEQFAQLQRKVAEEQLRRLQTSPNPAAGG
jgi:hypothetical protein